MGDLRQIRPDGPDDLGTDGRVLWDSLTADYDCCGLEHPLAEACRLQDRLTVVRGLMRGATPADLGRLVNAECKLIAAQSRYWRILGLDRAPAPLRKGQPIAKNKSA